MIDRWGVMAIVKDTFDLNVNLRIRRMNSARSRNTKTLIISTSNRKEA